jgi:membrane fusion protein, multidrug efflux system
VTDTRSYLVGLNDADRWPARAPSLPPRARLRFLTVIGLFVTACGSEATSDSKMPPARLGAANVISCNAETIDQSLGRVETTASFPLRSRVSGHIERVLFEEGQEVHAGDVLFVVDQHAQLTEVARLNDELERIRVQVNDAEREVVRARTLLETGAISKAEHDQRVANDEQVRAAMHTSEAAVAAALLTLELTEVRAPISGRAGRAFVSVGNLIIAGETVLATIVATPPLYV